MTILRIWIGSGRTSIAVMAIGISEIDCRRSALSWKPISRRHRDTLISTKSKSRFRLGRGFIGVKGARCEEKPPEVEAAIMAALLIGQGVCEVAAQMNVSEATISRSKAKISLDKLKELERKRR